MISTFIRKLPVPVEFCLVILICFWWGIYGSIRAIATRSWSYTDQRPTSFVGLGINLGEKDHRVIVVDTMPNTPAARAGLAGGLVIQKIGDTPTDGKSLDDCAKLISGPVGGKVTLELVDTANNKTNTVELTRANIQVPSPRIHFTNWHGLFLTIAELVSLAVTVWIGCVRGWPWSAWGFRPSWKLTAAGLLLCVVTLLVVWPIAALTNAISAGVVHGHVTSSLSLPLLFLVVVINPAFEEMMEVGYFTQSLERYGMWLTVLASALFRAFLHAYQGINALLMILPIGLIFGFVYWKWRRLWPLYIAHLIFDLVALFPRSHGL